MIRLGIFARTFDEPTLDSVLEAVTSHGIDLVHFNLRCAGLEPLPESIDDALYDRVRSAFERYQLEMIAISGTYNMIDLDLARRDAMTCRACRLIERARDLGTAFVTLCTGTRDLHNMWQAHRDNDTPEAWRQMLATLETLVPIAEAHGVTLGIEPEKANVINSATKARRLLDQMQSRHLKIVLDGANLFEPEHLAGMRQVLAEAFDLLGPDIAMVHAKDITDDPTKKQQAAGTGRLDWKTYFQGLQTIGYDGPIVLHNLSASEVDDSSRFVKDQIDQWCSENRK